MLIQLNYMKKIIILVIISLIINFGLVFDSIENFNNNIYESNLGVFNNPLKEKNSLYQESTLSDDYTSLLSKKEHESYNTWDPEDEGDHFPCGGEWWYVYTTLKNDTGIHWDISIAFVYFMNWTGEDWSKTDGFSYIRTQYWDRIKGECYDSIQTDRHPGKFSHKKNIVDLKYFNSSIIGLYPNYDIKIEDQFNHIEANIRFNAISSPTRILYSYHNLLLFVNYVYSFI